jgi:hypothetical protein
MNTSRLKELIDLLLSQEEKFAIQNRLNEVNGSLANLASQPQQAQFQTAFASALKSLNVALNNLVSEFEPSQEALLKELGASRFFSNEISSRIEEWVATNAVTPSVAQQQVQNLVNERQNFLTQIGQVAQGLSFLGIKHDQLREGEAEIGFLIPRGLFENHLAELIKELGTVNRIIRAFSEAALGASEAVEVRQISTSDPLFFFGINPLTIAAIGAAVTWALATWKSVEEIRKVRAETAKIPAFTPDDIKKIFDSKIKETISTAVAAQAEVVACTRFQRH